MRDLESAVRFQAARDPSARAGLAVAESTLSTECANRIARYVALPAD